MGSGTFRRHVLKHRRSFQKLFAHGKRSRSRNLRLVYLQQLADPEQPARIAICVTRRSGNAVYRNRLKRVGREAVDPFVNRMKPGSMIAIFPEKQFEKMKHPERIIEMKDLLRKANLMKDLHR